MIFEQHYLDCLSQASYLIGDATTGRAVVVDPRRDVNTYLNAAARHGVDIELVVETHLHADFLSGHLELAAATGASIAYGPGAVTEFPIRHLADGERIELGDVAIEIMHTPGHTPESICLVVYADATSPPHAVLTGDTMFIDDVGRPDLVSSPTSSPERCAAELYESIHDKLLSLPDATLVYPGHGAGSACGSHLSDERHSTIGEQRRSNTALAGMSLDEFVRRSTEHRQPPPRYFAVDAALNRSVRQLLDETEPPTPLTPTDVTHRQTAGAVVVDARDPDVFAAGHLAGSINVPLRARFAELAGKVLPHDADLVLITNRGDEREARNRLARIGYDRVVGYGVRLPSRAMRRQARIDAAELADLVAHDPALVLLDVREPGEVRAGAIDGAVAIPLGQLADRLDELDPGRRTVGLCASGVRSSVAASVLRAGGFETVTDLHGGYEAWSRHADASESGLS
jgi:glyoxylase-like metal-dependent hydrolase (beta-lactamase superfamily II)/rhodanese-related sulfurtransferase